MRIYIETKDQSLIKACQDIVRLFFQDPEFLAEKDDTAEVNIIIETKDNNGQIEAFVAVEKGGQIVAKSNLQELPVSGTEPYNQVKRVAKLALMKALEEYTGQQAGPWGILTGIRPTKIVHRLMDAKWPVEDIKKHLVAGYSVAVDKAELLLEIAQSERPQLLKSDLAGKLISIYIGIPFCPTRCAYCSFPAFGMEQSGVLVEPFLQALKKEIDQVGKYINARGLKVQTVYVGGGTPTSLDENQLTDLMQNINDKLISEETVEITVEAGRPDTITKEKMQVLKDNGVTRISINPQTMHAETLQAIGRNHQPWDVTDAVDVAREVGLNNINMDLIIGLPGETLDHIRDTMRYVGMMAPESITLHTLAVKRASDIKEHREQFAMPASEVVTGMFETAMHVARMMGMEPYYMYRQKQMVGPLENIGFSLQTFQCLYNIQMIEERQTIIGLGAGAGSKIVVPGDWTLENLYNPKDPQTYIERIEELWEKKVSELDKVFAAEH